MKLVVVVNMSAGALPNGGGRAVERIERAFRAAGLAPEIMLADRGNLLETVRSSLALGPEVVAVGGGDGSLGTAAGVLSRARVPLGVLPLGTFNHLAKDLKIPLDMEEAVAAIAAGRVREIDLGEVNGRTFINSSTIGAYADFVTARNPLRARRGISRWFALVLGAGRAGRSFPLLDVCLQVAGGEIRRRTPFLFVGNNAFDKGLFASMGGRSTIDRGRLSVYIARCGERPCLTRLVLRILMGRFAQFRDLESMQAEELTVHTSMEPLPVTADGEVSPMPTPVRYRIVPRGLRVIVPESHENDSSHL